MEAAYAHDFCDKLKEEGYRIVKLRQVDEGLLYRDEYSQMLVFVDTYTIEEEL